MTAPRRQPFAYRLGAALAVLTGRAQVCRCPTTATPPAAPRTRPDPMLIAIGMVTENLSGQSNADTINSLLADSAREDIPYIASSLAILAGTFARFWAMHDPSGPSEVLRSVALVTAEKEH